MQSAPGTSILFRGSARVTNLALLLLGAMLVGLSHHLSVEFGHFVIGYSETSACALAVSLGAAAIVFRQPTNRWTLWIVLTVAVLSRLVLLLPPPHLSSDIYRYVWDGYVQHHGINPYLYFPGEEHLRAFRDGSIYPHINRKEYAPTIYPPVAQMFFFAVTSISATVTMMKLAMDGMEAVTVFALMRILALLGRGREEVILYAWSPLCIWEVGSSGHIDAAVTASVSLALLFRLRRRPVLTGIALGAAVLFKFYPLLLFPALWERTGTAGPEEPLTRETDGANDAARSAAQQAGPSLAQHSLRLASRFDWKMPASFAAVVAFGYAVYASVGMKVFGFATGYAAEEGMGTGSRYFLLEAAKRLPGLHDLSTGAYLLVCALCFLPQLVWCWRCAAGSGPEFLAPAALLATTLMLVFAPHYPWYVLWLVPFLTLLPNLPLLVYIYSVFYWLTTRWAVPGPKMFYANTWIYGATFAAALLWILFRKLRASAYDASQ